MATIVKLQNLSVAYATRDGALKSLDNLSLDFADNAVTAVIGESGCGKTTLLNTIIGILPANAKIAPGSRVLFRDEDLLKQTREQQRRFRWQRASMVFQAAQNALNPTITVAEQLLDAIWDHDRRIGTKAARAKIIDLLQMVRLDPQRVMNSYPHQLSGGMRQRAVIAMAMVLDPELIILDEPTTALDMITQHYIFDILVDIQKQRKLAMILITHDIAIAARLADNMVVMYGGEIMETAKTADLFAKPYHPYSKGLLDSIPFIDGEIVDKKPIQGAPPDLIDKPVGCIFGSRCRFAKDACRKNKPPLAEVGKGDRNPRYVACIRKDSYLL